MCYRRAAIPKDRAAVNVNQDFHGTDGHTKVMQYISLIKYGARGIVLSQIISTMSTRTLNVSTEIVVLYISDLML